MNFGDIRPCPIFVIPGTIRANDEFFWHGGDQYLFVVRITEKVWAITS
jgi:hypothetical protein